MPRHLVRTLRHQGLIPPKGNVESKDKRLMRMERKIPLTLEGTPDSVAGTPETGDSKLPGQPDHSIRTRPDLNAPEDPIAGTGTVNPRTMGVGHRH